MKRKARGALKPIKDQVIVVTSASSYALSPATRFLPLAAFAAGAALFAVRNYRREDAVTAE